MKTFVKPFFMPVMAFFILAVMSSSCEKFKKRPINIVSSSVSDCLPLSNSNSMQRDTVFVKAVGENGLLITTVNTMTNCCDMNYQQEIVTDEQQVQILVTYTGSVCNCLCYRRMSFNLLNLEVGKDYDITIWMNEVEYYSFNIQYDLNLDLLFPM